MSVADIINSAQGFEDLSNYEEKNSSEKRNFTSTEHKLEKKTYYCKMHGKDASHPTEKCIVLNNAARQNMPTAKFEP